MSALLRSALIVSIGVLFPLIADAQTRIQILPIETMTVTTQQFLSADQNGRPATVAAELLMPPSGGNKLPAVILMHGSAGVQGFHSAWANELNSIGVAVLILDSFTGRGITNTATDQSQLDTIAMTVDAYRALAVLAKDPQIDSSRIAVMGFSKGASAALYSSMKRFQRAYGLPSVRFAAHIVLYNSCHTEYRDEENVSGAPIRLFHGEADDWNAASQCRAYVARLKKSGVDIAITEYPGAHHGYDNFERSSEPEFLSEAQTARNCRVIEGDRGLVNADTGTPYSINNECIERGVHVAYSEAATIATKKAVKDFLTSTFRLNTLPR